MSRKYMNDKWCVRCGRKSPTPYLRDNVELLTGSRTDELIVVDVGCGNGRNSEFMAERGHFLVSLDMVNDYGTKCMLGKDKMPVRKGKADIILCNYLLMFLSDRERAQVIKEIKRVAAPGARIMVELYAAKDSYAKTEEELEDMQRDIFKQLGWNKLRYSKGKFIAENAA